MKITKEHEKVVLREGGQRLASFLEKLTDRVVPGVTTQELNSRALELIQSSGDEAAFLGYTPSGASRPYPAALCTSVNDEVVHGIPNEKERALMEGDIVTLDMGLIHQGLFTDMAITVPVGEIDKEDERLIAAAREALTMAIGAARAGNTTGDIGAVVEATAARYGFTTPHELGGHGVGRAVHEEPFVPNFGTSGSGVTLEEGMVLAIEPIIIAGNSLVVLDDDGYTYRTKDGSRAAQFEHTVMVTNGVAEVVTKV